MQRFQFSPRHPIVRLGFTPDGSEFVTAQPHTSVAIRNRSTGEARISFPASNAVTFTELHVHPTARYLLAQCPEWCRVYELFGENREPKTFDSYETFAGITYTPGGFRLFHTAFPETLHAVNCGQVPHLGTKNLRIRSSAELVMATPDGRLGLAVRRQTRPVLLDLTTGRVVAEVQSRIRTQHMQSNTAVVACSRDGLKLAIANGDSLAVFDLSRVQAEEPPAEDAEDEGVKKVLYPLFTLDRPDPVAGRGTHADRIAERWLPPLAFDPTGQTLFTIGLRNRVQRIDVATGGVIVEWGWRADTVRCLAVSPDGLTAAAGCRQGELIVWDLE